MRILITNHYTLPHFGGIEVVVDELSTRFAALGLTVCLLAARLPGQAVEETVRGVRIRRVRCWNLLEGLGVPMPVPALGAGRVASREVAAADVVHCHGFLQPLTLLAARAAGRRGRPLVLTEHAGFGSFRANARSSARLLSRLESLGVQTLGRATLRRADTVTTVSTRVGGQLRRLGVAKEKLVHTPNGVDLDRFSPVDPPRRRSLARELGLDPARKRLLFVGRPHAKKGMDVFVNASLPGWQRVVVPTSEPGPALRRALAACVVLPPRDRADMPAVYQACHALALPSRGEGFPLVAQEAMACGLPVVLNDDPSYLDLVDPTVVSMIPPRPEALEDALRPLEDPAEYRRRSQASRKLAAERFPWSRTRDLYLEVFRALTEPARER